MLAAFSGFQGTYSPLHRAATRGHLNVCKAILRIIGEKKEDGEDIRRSGDAPNSRKKWDDFFDTVLNQKSHKGQTPLMLACDNG